MVPVFYLKTLGPKHRKGLACYWFILIRTDERQNVGLLNHEEVHIEQMHEHGLIKYLWRYFTKPKFRAKMEVEAFRWQGYNCGRIEQNLIKFYHITPDMAREVCYER